jgi:hypothetical protein
MLVPNTLFQSDLSLNTYIDVIFYLLAGVVIIQQKWRWLYLICVLASLNRETSGMIPLLLIPDILTGTNKRKLAIHLLLLMAVWAAVFVSLRLVLPANPMMLIDGNPPGWSLFKFNLRSHTWVSLLRTVGFLPLFGLACLKHLPGRLKFLFVFLLPAWLFIHFFAGVMAETRMLLVPIALLIIPAAMIGLNRYRQLQNVVATLSFPQYEPT